MRGQPAAQEDMRGKHAYKYSVGHNLAWPISCERMPPGPKFMLFWKLLRSAIESRLCIPNLRVVYDIDGWANEHQTPMPWTARRVRKQLTCGNLKKERPIDFLYIGL